MGVGDGQSEPSRLGSHPGSILASGVCLDKGQNLRETVFKPVARESYPFHQEFMRLSEVTTSTTQLVLCARNQVEPYSSLILFTL